MVWSACSRKLRGLHDEELGRTGRAEAKGEGEVTAAWAAERMFPTRNGFQMALCQRATPEQTNRETSWR